MTDYFVDATSGLDTNAGTSTTAPWQTIGKINGATFASGDRIYFKAGETWTGTALVPPRSNLYFGKYGTGNNPKLDGNDTVECISADTLDDLTFDSIECAQGLNTGFQFYTCTNINLFNCSSHDCGNDNVNFFEGCSSCLIDGGTFYNGYQRVAGTVVTGIEIGDDCHDMTIRNVKCYNNNASGSAGIVIISHAGTRYPYNVTIDNCYCYSSASTQAYGIYLLKQDATVDTDRNISITNCTVTGNTADGVRIGLAGVGGYVNGVTIEGLLAYSNTQYNCYFRGDNITLKRSIIHEGRMLRFDSCVDLTISNVTFYQTANNGYNCIQGYNNYSRQDGLIVKDCIFEVLEAAQYIFDLAVGTTTNVSIDYNYYDHPNATLNRWKWNGTLYNYANWKINSGQDANSQAVGDALLVNPSGDDFTLQSTSPAINMGVDLGEGDDIGAYQYLVNEFIGYLPTTAGAVTCTDSATANLVTATDAAVYAVVASDAAG